MSYSIRIINPETDEVVETDQPLLLCGGTYQLGGTTALRLNITYNYSPFYYRPHTLGASTKIYGDTPVDGALPVICPESGGIPGLECLSIRSARQRVLQAISNLRDEPLDAEGNLVKEGADNYWAATEANARRALIDLLVLLCLAPKKAKIMVS